MCSFKFHKFAELYYAHRAMEGDALSPPDRAGAVADAFSLASAGQLGMNVALGLATVLKNDPDNLVRETIVSHLSSLLLLYSQVGSWYLLTTRFDLIIAILRVLNIDPVFFFFRSSSWFVPMMPSFWM